MDAFFLTPAEHIYSAIVFLRRQGHAVYRKGADHLVNGRPTTSRDLLTRAFTEGWPKTARAPQYLGRLGQNQGAIQ